LITRSVSSAKDDAPTQRSRFNNTRLYEENGDIPPVELEQAYYRQHRPSA